MVWCGMCGDLPVSTSHAITGLQLEDGEHPTGISLEALLELMRIAPRSGVITARALIEEVVHPRTSQSRCAYTGTIPAKGRGAPLYYASFSWDHPFCWAVQSVLQHLGLPTHLSTPASGMAAGNDDVGSEASASTGSEATISSSTINVLAETFVFIDFLCLNLWPSNPTSLTSQLFEVGTLDSFDWDRRSRVPAARVHASRTVTDLGTHGRAHASRTRPDLTAQPETLLSQLDPERFASSVDDVLGKSLPVRALLLCLDPELAVLGQLIPMHAVWRAMRSRVPIQVAPGRDLCWPQHLQRPGIVFRLTTAEEGERRLREGLVKDVRDFVQVHNVYSSSSDQVEGSVAHMFPSSLPHEKGSLQKCLDSERCSLWRCLVRAAVPAEMQKKKAIMRHGMVHAVFLALDGQYSEARAQLLEVHAALLQAGGAGSRKLVQVLTLLVGVLLEQGYLQEAEKFSKEANEACAALSAASSKSRISAPHALAALTCEAQVLEALNQPEAAEAVWRRTYIQLDQEVGPRHHSTLAFMAHLGRNVSLLQARHEEGLLLLRECLKSVRSVTGHALFATSRPSTPRAKSVPQLRPSFEAVSGSSGTQPSLDVRSGIRHLPPSWQMRMLAAKLSGDMATALRQASSAQKEVLYESSPACAINASPSCACSTRIVAAFQAMSPEGNEPSSPCAARGRDGDGAEAEAGHFWAQVVALSEATCGRYHEASCQARLSSIAAKLLPHGAGSRRPSLSVRPLPSSESVDTAVNAIRAELQELEDSLGVRHVCTLNGRAQLAAVLEADGRLEEAEAEWQHVESGRRLALGDASLHVAAALSSLVACRIGCKRFAGAAEAAVAAAKATAEATGAESPQAAVALVQQAETLEAAGDMPGAENVYGQAAELHSRLYGKSNWRTKQVYTELAELYTALGREEDAQALKIKHRLRS